MKVNVTARHGNGIPLGEITLADDLPSFLAWAVQYGRFTLAAPGTTEQDGPGSIGHPTLWTVHFGDDYD